MSLDNNWTPSKLFSTPPSPDSRPVLVLSGGLDSSVLAASYCAHHPNIGAVLLTFDYNQRHKVEIKHASALTDYLNSKAQERTHQHIIVPMDNRFIGNSSQTNPDIPVPQGHYAEESMKLTVVPMRNTFFIVNAMAAAIMHNPTQTGLGYSEVYLGVHAGDHTIYPDCRPEFFDAMAQVGLLADWQQVKLHAPFINLTKADIVRIGAIFEVPFQLTWSCYEGGKVHCGKCATCVERREAFWLARVADPTKYECTLQESFDVGMISIEGYEDSFDAHRKDSNLTCAMYDNYRGSCR